MNRSHRAAFLRVVAAALLSLGPLGSAHSQAYPNKPIRLVIGFAAGSATDAVARALAEPLASVLGQQIIVDNRPGAGSTLATSNVAKS
ncbi:MAG TPA: tripartite tricarboxylate transporter substrate-binding protein, partial [Salinarimonas sp.]|nr:tripartite tricarboxylate transporter substrate-binding protein [Salinarimonas sp.]